VFKGLVLDLTLIPTTGKCIFSRSVNSHNTPTTLLEDRASDGKSKESGLASERSRRRFVLCPRQHRACGAAAVQVRSLRMRVVAVGADETRGKAGRRSAQGICLGIHGGRLEIVLISRPELAPRRARQIRVSVVPALRHPTIPVHRRALRIPSPDVAEGPDGVKVSSRRYVKEVYPVLEEI
jgi:hypothetical protein